MNILHNLNKKTENMNFRKYLLFNYRNLLAFALVSIVFLSCQKKDPFTYFQKESHSVGYKKITNIQSGADFSFGEHSILNIQSDINLELIMPEIKSFSECEIYYSCFDRRSYTVLVVCKGLGDSFKKKIIKEKGMTDFSYKEVFSDSRWFITALDANNVMVSTDVADLGRAMVRTKEKSIISTDTLLGLKKELPQISHEWFITNDKAAMNILFKPFIKDSLSALNNVNDAFISMLFFKEHSEKNEEKPVIIIEGSLTEKTDNNIINEIKSELSSVGYVRGLANSENYNFSNTDISGINNKFKIKFN